MSGLTQSRVMARTGDGTVASDLPHEFNKLVADVEAGASRPVLTASVPNYDPPSLAAGAGTTAGIIVTGAAFGDYVVISFDKDLQGLALTGYVEGANLVTFRLQNSTAGTVDLPSGTIRALVFPKASWVAGGGSTVTAKRIGNESGVAL